MFQQTTRTITVLSWYCLELVIGVPTTSRITCLGFGALPLLRTWCLVRARGKHGKDTRRRLLTSRRVSLDPLPDDFFCGAEDAGLPLRAADDRVASTAGAADAPPPSCFTGRAHGA